MWMLAPRSTSNPLTALTVVLSILAVTAALIVTAPTTSQAGENGGKPAGRVTKLSQLGITGGGWSGQGFGDRSMWIKSWGSMRKTVWQSAFVMQANWGSPWDKEIKASLHSPKRFQREALGPNRSALIDKNISHCTNVGKGKDRSRMCYIATPSGKPARMESSGEISGKPTVMQAAVYHVVVMNAKGGFTWVSAETASLSESAVDWSKLTINTTIKKLQRAALKGAKAAAKWDKLTTNQDGPEIFVKELRKQQQKKQRKLLDNLSR